MRIIFFGTPSYVLPILNGIQKHLYQNHQSPIVGVVTQAPKPAGRKKDLAFSEVDHWAHKRKIPKYYRPMELINQGVTADLGVLASYGVILPPKVIALFPKGILVIHPSLLPQFRGASPVPAAIITNTNPTGVTIFKMDEAIDHGPIITQFKEEILPQDTCGSLRDRLFAKSAQVLIDTLPAYLTGKIEPKPQDDTQATHTKLLTKKDGYLDLKITKPDEAERFIRAMTPWPGAWTLLKSGKRLKLLKAHLEKNQLVLDEVQLEGKNPVTWKQFGQAYAKEIFL